MSSYTLMLIEVSGIQEYVFGSNQLKQNIGASELVYQATTDWVRDELPTPNNLTSENGSTVLGDRSIDEGLSAEAVYLGGGNAMLIFRNDETALEFAGKLSRRAITEAPGLSLIIKRTAYDPAQNPLSQLHQQLRGEMAQRKRNRRFSTPLAGLGVTAECAYTGAPAIYQDDEGRLISAEVRAKLEQTKAGTLHLEKQLPQVKAAGYEFTYDFNQLGTPGESSYLAVVHIDGNQMGKRIKALGAKSSTDREYIQVLRNFSRSVQAAAKTALDHITNLLLEAIDEEQRVAGIVPVHDRQFPFRPIIFGGDDITFVSEGRLGLALATEYLRAFSGQTLADGRPVYARAGVAIVKTHYPFAQAYDLAEELCGSAKKYIQKELERDANGVDIDIDNAAAGLTALDWHFVVSGLIQSLDDVRKREYRTAGGTLNLRPLSLSDTSTARLSWDNFVRVIAGFKDENGTWAGKRNKIKALQEVLREGPTAVSHFLTRYPECGDLPSIPGLPDMQRQGWQGNVCGYYDAIEALDFYIPLAPSHPL